MFTGTKGAITMLTRRALSITSALVVGLLTITSAPVSAASGDVTSTPLTTPAAVSGASLAFAFNDGTGGSYQVYRSGQTRSMIRTLPTGTVDTAFNGGTAVAIGVPANVATSGAIRLAGITHAGTQKWWTVTTAQTPNDAAAGGVTLTSGDSKGSTTFTKSIAGSAILAKCNENRTGVTLFQTPNLQARRNGGVWLQIVCIVNGGNETNFIPLTDAGDIDTSVKAISAAVAHGGSGSCSLFPSVVADPTSKAPAPELWVIRTEHNYLESTRCVTGTNSSAQTTGVAGAFVALAALAVSADGTVTRTQLSTTPALQPGGLRIDPGGRPVGLAFEITDNSKVKMFRLKADGTLDTSVGTNGFRDLDTGALPAGATRLNTSITGVVTTADRTYFVISLYDTEVSTYSNVPTPRVHGYRMAMASVTDGFAKGFGTNGIGTRVTTTLPENWFSTGGIIATGATVNPKGEPQIFTIGETSTTLNVWAAITGATGGGEGGTGLGGFTRDTGGAPSAGEKSAGGSAAGATTGRVDTKIYASLPSTMQVDTAFTVLSASAARTQTLVSNTRSTCVVSGRHVVAISPGRCTVVVNLKNDSTTTRTLRTTVTRKVSTKGSEVAVSKPIVFSVASARLSKTARAQIAEIAKSATGAKAVVVVGHAAALTESPFNFAISRNRAVAVRDALRGAKVTAPITVTARGTLQQVSTKKTESAQAQNRRVVVYLIP